MSSRQDGLHTSFSLRITVPMDVPHTLGMSLTVTFGLIHGTNSRTVQRDQIHFMQTICSQGISFTPTTSLTQGMTEGI